MICGACGRDAVRLRVTFDKDKQGNVIRTYGCNVCRPLDDGVLLFNYSEIGGSNPRGLASKHHTISAAHLKDIRSRRSEVYDWDKPFVRSGVDRHRGQVYFDMGRK